MGGEALPLKELTNPARGKWRVRWGRTETESEGVYEWQEEEFAHEPTLEEIKTLVSSWHNERTEEKILGGFEWDGAAVWLSRENQMNYKAAHDLAAQDGGASLPVTFKFGTDEQPAYKEFATYEELHEFYVAMVTHVTTCLQEGWAAKDAIDWGEYE